MKEMWRPVPGFEQIEASNTGYLRNSSPDRDCKERRLQTNVTSSGAYIITFYNRHLKKFKTYNVAPLIARAWLGCQPFKNAQVMHLDGDRSNHSINNLKWATQSEIIRASYARNQGTDKVRKSRSGPKLSADDRKLARKLIKKGKLSQCEIARRLGCHNSTISKGAKAMREGLYWTRNS